MGTYRVLLIDDEKNIVEGLKLLIDWTALGCEVIATAHDGAQGHQRIVALKPDIVVCDIRMPYMTGLEMIASLPDCDRPKCIILSGYSDFEYAQTGISLGVCAYVLKPVEEDELVAALRRAMAEISSERSQQTQQQQLQRDIAAARTTAAECLLRDFIHASFDSEQEAIAYFDASEVPFPRGWHAALCVEIDKEAFAAQRQPQALQAALTAALQEAGFEAVVLRSADGSFAAVISARQKAQAQAQAFRAIMEKTKQTLHTQFHSNITIGIGDFVQGLHEIPQSYQQANWALTYRVLRGDNSVNSYSSAFENNHFITLVQQPLWKAYKAAISQRNLSQIDGCISAIFNELLHTQNLPIIGLQVNSLNIVLVCINLLNDMDVSFSGLQTTDVVELQRIYSTQSVEKLEAFVKSAVSKLVSNNCNVKSQNFSGIIAQVKLFLEQNILSDNSLVSVAHNFYISPVYLCQLFKKETGQLFNDYLTELKMEKAKELLAGRKLKVYEVADALGYKDAKYFSRLFEKRTGQKPSEFCKRA